MWLLNSQSNFMVIRIIHLFQFKTVRNEFQYVVIVLYYNLKTVFILFKNLKKTFFFIRIRRLLKINKKLQKIVKKYLHGVWKNKLLFKTITKTTFVTVHTVEKHIISFLWICYNFSNPNGLNERETLNLKPFLEKL